MGNRGLVLEGHHSDRSKFGCLAVAVGNDTKNQELLDVSQVVTTFSL